MLQNPSHRNHPRRGQIGSPPTPSLLLTSIQIRGGVSVDKLDDFNPLFWVIYFSNILFLRKFVKNFAWPARAVETDHDLSAGLGVLKISYDFLIFLNHLFQFWKLFPKFCTGSRDGPGLGVGGAHLLCPSPKRACAGVYI